MKLSFGKLLIGIVAAFIILSIVYTLQGSEEGELSYVEQVEEDRKAKEELLTDPSEESPLTAEQLASFQGLNYYPPKKEYKIRGKLEKAPIKSTIRINTSKGEERNYLNYGKVVFKLNGQEHSLTVLKPINAFKVGVPESYLFLAFTDETSGFDTYGAGRYLELEEAENTNELTLDFNYAYNPYCAYNDEFDCPFPPKGNHLAVKVEAGEKNFK